MCHPIPFFSFDILKGPDFQGPVSFLKIALIFNFPTGP